LALKVKLIPSLKHVSKIQHSKVKNKCSINSNYSKTFYINPYCTKYILGVI